jgi:predicted enzyme related to lactoylglutathione lyase
MQGIGGLEAVIVDCADPEALGPFWGAMFGTAIVSREPEPPHYVDLAPVDGVPMIVFQQADEPKTVKNRLHFDVKVADIDAATERLESLGGRRIDAEIGHEVGYAFRAVADPEGNEFCLVRHDTDLGPSTRS